VERDKDKQHVEGEGLFLTLAHTAYRAHSEYLLYPMDKKLLKGLQLLQQSLSISFDQALAALGINIVILTYARALVAVFLGAVLALSNVETEMSDSSQSVATRPKRRIAIFDKMLDRVAPW
jgi:hypothetical protein